MASTPLHFILFPLMAQGHMIPMVDIARLLARRGATVTIVTTPVNASRFKPIIDRAIKANLNIQVLQLQLPSPDQSGLPDGCESADMLPSAALLPNLFAANATLEEPAETVLRTLTPKPSCIISDCCIPWTTDVARRLYIPRIVFYGPGCFSFLCIHIVMNTNIVDEVDSDSDYFVLPGLPDRIEVTKPQLVSSGWACRDSKENMEFYKRCDEATRDSYGIIVNSFEELEPKYVEEFAKAKGKKVWCVGPVSQCNENFNDIAERGMKAAINEHDCLKWLDSRETGSVVYVCLGSLSHSCTEQAIELALGLESSNVPFIWFVRRNKDDFDRWLEEEGYVERVKDRGLVVHGWAPQLLILSHEAIGGFVTHCGWNSTLEAISAGIPMVTWPHFADQFLNERFITDVLKIGVRIGAEVPVSFGKDDKYEVVVKTEDVKNAIEGLMKDDEESKARRRRVRELAKMAKMAMAEGGSSHRNMTSMIRDISEEIAKTRVV